MAKCVSLSIMAKLETLIFSFKSVTINIYSLAPFRKVCCSRSSIFASFTVFPITGNSLLSLLGKLPLQPAWLLGLVGSYQLWATCY